MTTSYRIQKHPDTKGFPNHYAVQAKPWYSRKFRFLFGFIVKSKNKIEVYPQYNLSVTVDI